MTNNDQSTVQSAPTDLRKATNRERRFALAYLRWLAGRRSTEPNPKHKAVQLTAERGREIMRQMDAMIRDASNKIHD